MRWRLPSVLVLILVIQVSPPLLEAQERESGNDTSAVPRGALRLATELVSFAPTALGDSSIAFLTVHNDSLRPVTVTAVQGANESFYADQAVPFQVQAGASAGIRLVYSPRHFGRTFDTLLIVTDIGDSKMVLRGRSPYPIVETDKETVDFDTVARGTISEQTIVLSNPSINTLTIDSISTRTPVFHALITQAAVPHSDSVAITIVFSPVLSGSFVDTLVIESNARERRVEIPLLGVSPPPVLSVSMQEVRFGQVSITDSAMGRIPVVDASISTLTLQSITTGGSEFSVRAGPAPSVVHGNDSAYLPVLFRPRTFGEFVDTLIIESDGGSARIPLRGKSPYPILMTNADTVAFGDVRKGSASRRSIIIKNPSINVLRLDSVYTRTKWFTARVRKTSVHATDSLALDAIFVPDRFRSFSDTIVIVGNSLNRRVEIPVRGVSPLPLPEVAIPSLELEPVSLGDTCFGEFVVHNRSAINDLTVGGVRKRSHVFAMASRLPVVVACRDSVSLRVRFTVSEAARSGYGLHADTLQIESDGGGMRVAVTGSSPYPSVASASDKLDFGSVQKGEKATVQLWLTNPSLNTLRIDSVAVRFRDVFAVTGMEFPGSIRKGRAHSLTVAFAPDSDNVFVDTIRIFSNAPGPPLNIAITGRCYAASGPRAMGVGIPTEFCLFKNYPNPFKGTTTIKFGLPHPNSVSLAVFNTLGQLVVELANGYHEAGYHTVTFSSTGLSSGLYFYRFQSGEFVDTKKLVVLR